MSAFLKCEAGPGDPEGLSGKTGSPKVPGVKSWKPGRTKTAARARPGRSQVWAAALLLLSLALAGCGRNRDAVDGVKARGELVAAVVKEEGETLTRDEAYARELERQALEQLAAEMNVTLRYEEVEEAQLSQTVDQGKADVAAGVPVLPGNRDEGYSVTYGRRAAFLAVKEEMPLGSRGELANTPVGYARDTGELVQRQAGSISGVETVPLEGAQAGARELLEDGIAAYICYEGEARELLETEGIKVLDLQGLGPETYAFYIKKGEYRLMGLANQVLTGKLTE